MHQSGSLQKLYKLDFLLDWSNNRTAFQNMILIVQYIDEDTCFEIDWNIQNKFKK